MTPVEGAAAVYEREGCARTFREDLEAHLLHGYVFSTPSCFLMGRPVVKGADPVLIVNPWHVFERERCDCWMVYLCAGDMREAFVFAPYALPWVCWQRKNKLRYHCFERARGLAVAGCSQFL